MLTCLICACEYEVQPTLEKANPVLVVDAWIDSKLDTQTIILSYSKPFFETKDAISYAVGAQVEIVDDQEKIYKFLERENKKGYYIWEPIATTNKKSLVQKDRTYTLTVQLSDGKIFKATSKTPLPPPPIDSLTLSLRDGGLFSQERYLAEFWATDPVGTGNTYFIKSYKNGVKISNISNNNIAYDAGFSPGGNIDGIVFIPPIRGSINNTLLPYMPGDSVSVELYAITHAAFDFLNQVAIQTDRPSGFAGLFSSPFDNVNTNIQNEEEHQVIGFFNVAIVSSLGKRLYLKN